MHRGSGFTLIELIMVIVILAVVSLVSVRFISFSSQGAIDTAERQQLAAAGGIISEILSRDIREALPASIRTRESGRCVEFIPIISGGRYQGQRTELHSEFETRGAAPDPVAGRVVVYPYAASPYAPGMNSAVSSVAATWDGVQVSYDGGEVQRFAADSPRARFFLINEPVTYCQSASGGQLQRFSGYGLGDNFTDGDEEIVATGLVADSSTPVFQVEEASLTRNALVVFTLRLQARRGDENYQLSQEVQIRNVP